MPDAARIWFALMEVRTSNYLLHFTSLNYLDIFHTPVSGQRKSISVKDRSVFMEKCDKCPFKGSPDSSIVLMKSRESGIVVPNMCFVLSTLQMWQQLSCLWWPLSSRWRGGQQWSCKEADLRIQCSKCVRYNWRHSEEVIESPPVLGMDLCHYKDVTDTHAN